MVRRTIFALALALTACREPHAPAPPFRESLGTLYVAGSSAEVRERPSETSRLISTYPAGEAVSILGRKNGWAEIRLPDGSGWIRRDQLTAAETLHESGSPPQPRFVRPPAPVFVQTAAHGVIVLEARVNSDGEVIEVRTLTNSTGSKHLERLNEAELRRSRFEPMMIRGQRQPFVYEYRASY